MCTLCRSYIQVFQHGVSLCCPAWNSLGIVPFEGRTVKEVWDSEEFRKAHEAVLLGPNNGFCKRECPYNKQDRDRSWIRERKVTRIMIAFDDTCNLRCKTCRNEILTTDRGRLKELLVDLEQSFGHTLEHLEISGSGDPFASPEIVKWLQTLTEHQFPKLKSIIFQTNGTLLSERMYNSLSNFVKSKIVKVVVSVDAANKKTYEEIRRGGNWEQLIHNLEFLATLKCSLAFCFVIQQDNYKEIVDFYNLCQEIKRGSQVLYETVQWWGDRISEEDFKKMDIISDETREVRKELRSQIKTVTSKGAMLQGVLPPNLEQIISVI